MNRGNSESPLNGVTSLEFSEKSIRLAFIRKVYSLLMCQLIITMAFVFPLAFYDPAKMFVAQNSYLLNKAYAHFSSWVNKNPTEIVALIVLFVTMIAMGCCESVRRKSPMNLIFLFLFTIAEGFLVGVVAASYRPEEVVLALVICVVLCFALTVFSFQTKIDFTAFGGYLLVFLIVLTLFGFIMIFFPRNRTVETVYACLGAFLFGVYLIYDTQIMIGGGHKYSISAEEYIFATLNLYLDIINMFLYILRIIGASRD